MIEIVVFDEFIGLLMDEMLIVCFDYVIFDIVFIGYIICML